MNELLQEGRYRITRHFGQNGVGPIYEGIDNIFEKNVLINQYNYKGRKNLADEEKILKNINHESFSTVNDYFAEPNGWFVIMEAAEGRFFNEVLNNDKLELSATMNWAEQILDGLTYLHLHLPAIIYGEIKPQNIFLTSNGKVKMLTSAILKNRQGNAPAGNLSVEDLNCSPLEQIWNNLDSASQKVIGDSYDEAAEKNLHLPLDARCDIYSLGVLLYQTLTGQVPANALERSIEILEGNADPLVSPSALNAEVPPEISEVILKALHLKREDRFSAAVIMRQALRTAFIRIKEREEEKNKQDEYVPVFKTQETFCLAELNPAEKIRTIKTPKVEKPAAKSVSADYTPPDDAQESKSANDFEDSSRELPQADFELPEEIFGKTAAFTEPTIEEIALQKELDAAKRVSSFFDFDESDEVEILGSKTSSEKINKDEKIDEEIDEYSETAPEAVYVKDAEKVVPEIPKSDYKENYSSDEYSILFNESEKTGSKWKIPVIVLLLLLVGGGAFGAWTFLSKQNPAQVEQSVSTQPAANSVVENTDQPPAGNLTEVTNSAQPSANSAETQAPATAENTEPTTETNPVLSQETQPTAKKQTVVKPKPTPAKPQTAEAKPAPKKEKKVTVDDLIKDF